MLGSSTASSITCFTRLHEPRGNSCNPGDLPQFFPENRAAAIEMTDEQLNELADFYNLDFAGNTLAERRVAFLNYI
mgnify:CR=1 FL=1